MSVASNIRGFSRLAGGEIDAGLADLALAREFAVGSDSARLRYWVNQSDALNLPGYEDAVRTAEEGAERAAAGVERTSGAMLLSNVIAHHALGQTGRADDVDRALELDAPIGFSAPLRRSRCRRCCGRGIARGRAWRLARLSGCRGRWMSRPRSVRRRER
jgi:hypothetical protein